MPSYISKSKFAEQFGIPLYTVSNWMRRHWTRDYHYTVIGRMTVFHLPRVEEWLNDYFRTDQIKDVAVTPNVHKRRKATSREEIEKVLERNIK